MALRQELKRTVGSPVVGNRFFDREAEMAAFEELLREGAHILMVAPRRTGKTSLMRQAALRLRGDFTCIAVDVQDCRTAADAIVAISLATREHRSVWSRVQDVFHGVLQGVEELGGDELAIKLRDGVAADWRAKGTRLMQELSEVTPRVILFLDEVPILINKMLKGRDYQLTPQRVEAAEDFVSWLRKTANVHAGTLRLVVTGSIGLEPVLRQAGLSAQINELHPFRLEAWSPEVAMACLEALARNYGLHFEEAARADAVERLGLCIPHHVQLFFSLLYDQAKRDNRQVIQAEHVAHTWDREMLSNRGHAELSHMEERLKLVLGPGPAHVLSLDLLTEAAVVGRLSGEAARTLAERHGKAARPMDLLRTVLDLLEHDGYLLRGDSDFGFASKLIRDWWRARFGFGYRTVAALPAEELDA